MGITYKEYAWLINPAYLDTTEFGGVKGCPESYGFEKHWCDGCGVMSCNDCWNREISYPVIAEAVEETEIYPIMQTRPGSKFEVCEVDINTNSQLGARILIGGQKFWVNHKCFKYYIDKEEKKVQKEFTEANLKNGMVVELRNGERGIVIGKRIVTPHNWYDITVVSESDDGYSVAKVWDVSNHITGLDSILSDSEVGELIRESKEKEISSEEAFAVLKEHYGCDVKIKE